MGKRRATINFAAQDFRAKHGFLPRGVAKWVFYFSDEPQVPWLAASIPLTYTAAKQFAVIEARRRGVTAVRVDPNPQELRLYDESTGA